MNKAKKTQVATILLFAILAVVVAIVGFRVYNQKETKINELQAQNQSVITNLQERDSLVNEFVSAMNDIEDNLKFIKEKRQQLSIETEREGGRDQKQAIIDDINLMNDMLEKSSSHINDLEKKLKNSGFEISSLKKKIDSLNESVEEQNIQIAEFRKTIEEKDFVISDMNNQIDDMKMQIAQKSDTLQQKEEVINQKTNKLNTAYVAYGSYKELKDRGLLIKDGGFLWLGRHTSIKENFDDNVFTELDIRDTKNIPLFSPKVKMISEHPDSSYSFVEEDGQIAYLHIDNPEEFWKISKYAVIETK